jgi:peptidoglycan hydrolase-like protein with peptidoglycan-binding domain
VESAHPDGPAEAAANLHASGTIAPPHDAPGVTAPALRRRPQRRWLAALALAIAGLAVLAVVLLGSGTPKRAAADTGIPPGDTTATVTRRTLSEGSTVDGTLGYGSKLDVYDRLSGTFTWLPAVGAVIGRGATLFRLNDERVVLMYGAVPAYRALKRGVGDGPDVAELNTNLVELGFDPYGAIGDHESFGEATAAAVRRWQKAAGLPETGEVELGRVVFAPGARRVTEVHVSLGQDPPGEEPAATTPAATTPAATTPAATTPATTTPASTTPAATPTPSHKSPSHKSKSPSHKSKTHKPKSPSHNSPSHKAPAHEPAKAKPSAASAEPAKEAEKAPAKESSGKPGSAGAGELALATTATQQIVTLAVKAEQQQLARIGETVPVTLPGGRIVHGRIATVGTVASEPKASGEEKEKGGNQGNEGESATISVTIALDHPVAHLDQAPVSVELVRSIRRHVLTVPATALIATAAGGYAVEVLQGARRVTLAVTPGMFAGGYVEVEGTGLHEGLRVIQTR